MHTIVLLSLLFAFLQPTFAHDPSFRFMDFLNKFDKSYTSQEELFYRRAVFDKNQQFIEEFNSRSNRSYTLEVNQFSDLTRSEFKERFLMSFKKEQKQDGVRIFRHDHKKSVPSSVDWRTKGAVTPVKDQLQCGSCWAFSATGALEGAWFLAHQQLISLSEEELVDCSSGAGNEGCNGGEPSWAFDWIVQNQICTEKDYPYTSYQDECHNQFTPCVPVVNMSSYKSVTSGDQVALQAAVAIQPISVLIEADSDSFRFYKGGVYNDPNCGTYLDHAVLAVGYGSEGGKDYWLVKNSWGNAWGDAGYIKIAKSNSRTSPGQCGIALQPTFPVIE